MTFIASAFWKTQVWHSQTPKSINSDYRGKHCRLIIIFNIWCIQGSVTEQHAVVQWYFAVSILTHTLPYTCSDTFQTSVHKITSPSLSGIRRPHQTSSWYCALCHRTFWCTGSKPVYPPHYQCTVGEIITHYPSGNPYQPSSSKKLLSPTFYITPGPSSGYYRMSVVKSHRRPFLHPLAGGQNVNWVIRRCWMEDISLVERLKCLGALKGGLSVIKKKRKNTQQETVQRW